QVETKDTKPETKDTKQKNASDDEARKPAAKDEDRPRLPAPVAVVVVPTLPASPPAGIGLPAIGIEPGSRSAGTPDQAEAIPNVGPAAEPAAKVSINPPTPPVEAAPPDPKPDPRPDPKMELSFAMRLVSLIPEREAEPKADTPQQTQQAPRPEIDAP